MPETGVEDRKRDGSGGWESKVGSICETENSPKAGTVSPHADSERRDLFLHQSWSLHKLCMTPHQPGGLQPCRSHQTKNSLRGSVYAHMGGTL